MESMNSTAPNTKNGAPTRKRIVKIVIRFLIGLALIPVLLTAYFYIGGIEWGDWTIPDEAELRLENRDVPDEDNAYLALIALTNLYRVAEGDDESAEISDKPFVRYYGNPFFRDGDNDEREKWTAARNDPASRGRAEKLLAGNARFFEAFRPALRRKDFQTAGAGEPEGNPFLVQLPLLKPIVDFSMLAGLKVQAGLERGDTEAAAADIADIRALGQMMAARIGPDSNGFVQFMVGKLLVKIAYGKMCDAVAMGKATGEMLQEFRKMLDEDEASAPAGRERALKAAWERRFLGVDWYCDHPDWFIPGFHDIDPVKGTVTPTILYRILSNWPGYARFAYHRREMKFMEAAALRAALAGKTESYVGDNEPCCGWWTALAPGCAGRFAVISLSPFLEPYFKEDALVRSRIRLILAAEKWRRAHGGENPPALDALVPDYLAAVPKDPWSKSGEPIKYDAESGVAWSIGKEGEYDYRKVAKERKPADADKPLDVDTLKYAFRLDGKPIVFTALQGGCQ